MARKENHNSSREAKHNSSDNRDRRHLEPRAGDSAGEGWVSREPPIYFFAAFGHEDEIPSDLPRD